MSAKVRNQLKTKKQFSRSESEQKGQKWWIFPSRAMGVVYGQALAEHYKDLDFPLLNSFSGYLKKEQVKLNQIIVLLTDQSDGVSVADKDKPSHPYWKDTCTLKPILKHYLEISFPDVVMDSDRDFPVLKSGSVGLDDWNEVLTLVRQEFVKLDIPENATVYVSHQAGTPAISSAVQFASLAQFERRVRFLVSNEYDSTLTGLVESSSYLRELQREKAKKLLACHDYSSVKELLYSDLKPEIKILLDAAITWNFAKFEDFAEELLHYPDNEFVKKVQERTQEKNWWWTAYESAYLGVVRLKQENTVEAMFHSFRAFEGLAIKDAERHGISGKFGRKAFKSLRHRKQAEWNRHPYIKTLIDLDTTDQEQRNDLLDKRNNLFHQLQGFQKNDLFNAWASDESHWQEKALGCLNFVSGETFKFLDKEESDGTVASLMVKVHQKLENAIAAYL